MYTDKYKDWRVDELCKAEKEMLLTMKDIRKERRDDDEKALSHDQTDQYKDCIMALRDIAHIRLMSHELTPKVHVS